MGNVFPEKQNTKQGQSAAVAQPNAAPASSSQTPATPGLNIKVDDFSKEDLKILILGPGESGKSTYWRQLRNIYTGGLSVREKKNLIGPIRINLIHDIQVILENSETTQIDVASELSGEVDLIKNLAENDDDLDPDVAEKISLVWNDPGAKTIYKKIHSCFLSDHSDFFLDSAQRIAAEDYVPTDEDVIKSRIRTIGVNEIKLKINDKKIKLVDVGGQQCERAKWKNVFNNVNAIIFVVSLADFDQTMFEDQNERRTTDSIQLFKQTISNDLFKRIPIYLILNKQDEFERKIKTEPGAAEAFKASYPSFNGNVNDTQQVIKFIQDQYISQADQREPGAEIKPFVTTALQQDKLNETFLAVSQNLLTIEAH